MLLNVTNYYFGQIFQEKRLNVWLVAPTPSSLSPISMSLHYHHSHRKALAARNTDTISVLLISVLHCVEILPIPQRETAGAQRSMA